MEYFIGFIAGILIGIVLTILLTRQRSREAQASVEQAFRGLAADALDDNTNRLTEKMGSTLDQKKALIDETIKRIDSRLVEVRRYVEESEQKRHGDFSRMDRAITDLSRTTGELHQILGSTQRRGAWGERMAGDILQLAGLQEGVNYEKQSSTDVESGRPDFTFFLPNSLKLNMDVKFPLGHYKAWLDAGSEEERDGCLKELVGAVRRYVRDVSRRGYIDPKVPTVNYVLVFLPSEQILSLVLQSRPDVMDETIGLKVVLASPLTLYAVLAVVRQAAENANVLRTASKVTDLLNEFRKQWDKYKEEMDKLGSRIEAAGKQFEVVRGTRTNVLERPLNRIEDLSKGLAEGEDES